MQIAYIFFYLKAFPYNLNKLGVTIGKKPAPGDHEFNFRNLKVSMIVVLINCCVDEK